MLLTSQADVIGFGLFREASMTLLAVFIWFLVVFALAAIFTH
jgi:hypothetical protein